MIFSGFIINFKKTNIFLSTAFFTFVLIGACARKTTELEFPPINNEISITEKDENKKIKPILKNDLTNLDSIFEVINSVPKGRKNPFSPITTDSDSINEIQVLGFLLTDKEKRAFVRTNQVVSIICEGPRGLCENSVRSNNNLLPEGSLVLSINHLDKCITVLKDSGEERNYCME